MAARLITWTVSPLIRWLGWSTILSLGLLFIALGSAAYALAEVVRGPSLSWLLPVTAAGLLLGWFLAAARPLPAWLAALVIFSLSLEAMLWRVGRLGDSVIALVSGLAGLPRQLWTWPVEPLPAINPVIGPATDLWLGLSIIANRGLTWALALAYGQPIFDPVAITLVWSLALIWVAAWAGWGVRRLNHPLLALAPAGALLATTLAYALRQTGSLLLIVGAALLLMGLVNYQTRERRWQATGLDYSTDIRTELGFAVVAITFCLVMIASAAPSLSISAIVRPVQAYFRADTVNESLGLQRSANPSYTDLPLAIRAPGLPRQHLLGSGPELAEQVALVIRTNEAPPVPAETGPASSPPRHYWRSLTYDAYTGRGWLTTETTAQSYQAGEAAIPADRPGRRVLHQEVQVIASDRKRMYAAGELVTADHDYTINWRSAADPFAATIDAAAYQVDSLIPVVGEADLRAAGANYPNWVSRRYLKLPPQLPGRIRTLALDLTATAPTPYDRAKAIEQYLRAFPYTLDLPKPPRQRDIVDYFLFDLQRGYCDYYATAMVVLARAAGLPARLAVGYLSGVYDADAGRYVATEADAHAWVEIYFPEYGWINFEPTGGRPALERPAETAAPVPELNIPIQAEANTGKFRWRQTLAAGLALLLLVGLGWWLVESWRLQQAAPAAAVTTLYRRLHRHGQRLALVAEVGHTPYEFAAMLVERVTMLLPNSRWHAMLAPAPQEIRHLTELYVQSCYSPHPLDTISRTDAIRTWRRLRPRLWLARLYFIWTRLK